MSTTGRARSVLIVEDEAIVATDLSRQLESNGYEVVGLVGKAADVLPAVRKHKPSVVLMDVRLHGNVDGVTIAEEVFVCEDTAVVFLSAFSDKDIIRRAAQSGAYAYLTKPVTTAALVSSIEMAIHKHEDLCASRRDAHWFRLAFNALDLALVGLDHEGKVRFMNNAAVQLTGWRLLEAKADKPPWVEQLQRVAPTKTNEPPHTVALQTRADRSADHRSSWTRADHGRALGHGLRRRARARAS